MLAHKDYAGRISSDMQFVTGTGRRVIVLNSLLATTTSPLDDSLPGACNGSRDGQNRRLRILDRTLLGT